jgi:hypothetical protein
MGLLLSLFFTICVFRESFIRLITLWRWRLVLARTFVQVHHLFSISFSTTSVIGSIALWVVFAYKVVPFAVAPFARWVEHGLRGFDVLQAMALLAIETSSLVCLFFFSTHPLCLLYATVNDKIILFFHCSKAPINALVFHNWSI